MRKRGVQEVIPGKWNSVLIDAPFPDQKECGFEGGKSTEEEKCDIRGTPALSDDEYPNEKRQNRNGKDQDGLGYDHR
jgi:hypothetical protein